jgi:putative nucleotidyltransferase with HDIG domain
VAQLACAIAGRMGLPESQIEGIRVAAMIHDIGKISSPVEILNKPGTLTAVEMGIIREHPKTSYEILEKIPFPWPVAQIALQHHERIDGSGYPAGLKGEEILLEAKIIAVADVVEAMSTHRPFRPKRVLEESRQEILKGKGVLYDPGAVEACLQLFESGELVEILEEEQSGQ